MPTKTVTWSDPNRSDLTYRLVDVGGGVVVDEVIALSPTISRVAGGRFYLAGSGQLTLAAAGNVRALIANPAGSGRNLSIVRVVVFATAVGYATVYINPTTGLPSGPRAPMNALVGGGEAAVGTVNIDTHLTTSLAGGVETSEVIGIPSNSRISIDLPPFVLAPGVSLGINVPFAGAADAVMSAYWFEDDVS